MAKDKLVGLTPKDQLIATMRQRLGSMPPDVSVAFKIASDAFFMAKDKNGRPYMEHLTQVCMSGTKSTAKQIVGLLHDLIEDTAWTLEDLRALGFKPHIIQAVDAVTRRQGEPYFDFIVRCGKSVDELPPKHRHLAVDVKLADLEHNMALSRETRVLHATTKKAKKFLDKCNVYIIAYNYLVALKKRDIVPSCSMTGFIETRPKLYNPDLLQEYSSDPVRQMLFTGRGSCRLKSLAA